MHKTQEQLVLEYLEAGHSITPIIAQAEFQIFRLAAVIKKLRNKGYNIATAHKMSFNKRQYAEYTLVKETK